MEKQTKSYGMEVSFQSEKPDGFHKKISFSPIMWRVTWILCLSIFLVLIAWGIIMTELFKVQYHQTQEMEAANAALTEQTLALQTDLDAMTQENTILSSTVTHKMEEDETRAQEEVKLFVPDGIPVNGAAVYEEKLDDNERPYLEFTADLGTEIVSTGSGKVILAEADPKWGYRITIDHGNGYVTSYHVRENPKFLAGSEVRKGEVLFAVTKNNRTLEYTVIMNGSYVNPVTMMEVFG